MLTVFTLADLNTQVLHSDMNFNKYETIIWEFITEYNFTMILISFFLLSFISLNLQYLCHIIHNFDILMNEFILIQTERHLRWFKQIKIIKFYHYFVKNSFNIHQLQNRLITKLKWKLSSHQDLVSSQFWFWLDVRLKALISQRFDLISSHKKIFHLILQEEALISILSHLISWKTDFISWRCDFISILSHLISWKISLILLKCDLILISSYFISQKHDFILILTWDQNRTEYSDSDLVIQTIWCRKSREYYQVALLIFCYYIF